MLHKHELYYIERSPGRVCWTFIGFLSLETGKHIISGDDAGGNSCAVDLVSTSHSGTVSALGFVHFLTDSPARCRAVPFSRLTAAASSGARYTHRMLHSPEQEIGQCCKKKGQILDFSCETKIRSS